MREVYKAIGRVAAQDVPVLITGESGTGKELVARAIYQHGPRAKAPFLALNCAAIPENLLESELFGHEKGAFTGAERRRIGKFEQCSGGTLFLDEIGDMPLASQAKVLRLLQEQAFERVGGNETVRTDVRLIAATHRDLEAWSAEGKFRPDLYYRLGVFTIHLPPLRERGDDLPMLVHHYVRRFNRELSRDVREVTPEAMERLQQLPLAGQHPRAAERPEAGVAACDRPGPGPGIPARVPGRTPHDARGDRGGRGGVAGRALPPAAHGGRQQGDLPGGAPAARPAPPAAGARVDRRQQAPGRPAPGDHAEDAPAEAPRAGPVRSDVRRGGRGRRPSRTGRGRVRGDPVVTIARPQMTHPRPVASIQAAGPLPPGPIWGLRLRPARPPRAKSAPMTRPGPRRVPSEISHIEPGN